MENMKCCFKDGVVNATSSALLQNELASFYREAQLVALKSNSNSYQKNYFT